MALFQCDECGCVENTAHGQCRRRNSKNLVISKDLGRYLCSADTHPTFPSGANNPKGGRWHNYFRRDFLEIGKWKMDPDGYGLIHKETGVTNWQDHIIRSEGCNPTPKL